MAEPLSPPRLLPSGDSAITVEFSRTIDDAANRRVLALDRVIATFPGIAISLLVLGINLIGDGLRDALDPRLRR